ncbi:hypothetical protein [Herbaspirillum robiniae]|uniref:hypothetical protein n=1 Tax=Herbaspirillum robiniae TaxID=2014887 RepID=UPI00101AE43E|nr:hypothetical protein [Herbaspirillum robiniae]
MKYQIALLLSFGLCATANAQRIAQPSMDIVSIANQFIVSGVAAKKCSLIDAATEQAFRTNFLAVSIRKIQVLKERNPQLTDDQIAEQDKESTEQYRARAEQVISQYGCQSPAVQELIQRYKAQAAWKIGG